MADPRLELPRYGAYTNFGDQRRRFDLGLVCLEPQSAAVRRWFSSMEKHLAGEEGNAERFREFPGTPRAFGCTFEIADRFVRTIDPGEGAKLLSYHPAKRFEALLDRYCRRVESLFLDGGPATVIVARPL